MHSLYFQIYFFISCVSISSYLYEERAYLTGKIEKPVSKSFLGASPSEFITFWIIEKCINVNNLANMLFNMMFLGCSILGTISSVLAVFGLKKDQREFLVPWILIMSLDIFVAVIHFIYVVIFGNLKFAPLTGMLFTVDFFMLCLNVSTNNKIK